MTDLVGKKYGRLTVIKDSGERTKKGTIMWLCQCECGNPTKARGYDLAINKRRSCGCLTKEKDKTGKRYNRLLVLGRDTQKTGSRAKWLCKCDCGKKTSVVGKDLVSGNTKSCGCLRNELCKVMFKYVKNHKREGRLRNDLTGKVFGRLTVLNRVPRIKGYTGVVKWRCRCVCGKIKTVGAQALTSGQTVSCGCYNKEIIRKLPQEAYILSVRKRNSQFLTDRYIKELLSAHKSGLQVGDIPPRLIELKREQIELNREIRNRKGEMKNGTN